MYSSYLIVLANNCIIHAVNLIVKLLEVLHYDITSNSINVARLDRFTATNACRQFMSTPKGT